MKYSDFRILKEFSDDFPETFQYVKECIGDDKAIVWFFAENPSLGYIKPIELIWQGVGHKVVHFIECTRDENGDL
jgi:adenine-specific DNA methylase